MTTQTSQGVASRLGYGLGQVVRLVWWSQNRTTRWVKRLALIALAVLFWTWLANAFIAVLTVGIIFLALMKGAISPRHERGRKEGFVVGWQDGPDGWGYYDMYGNCHMFGDADE